MTAHPIEMNTILAAVYYNIEKPSLFRVCVGVTLCDLKDQVDQINDHLNHDDTRRMDNVEYRRPLINSDGRGVFCSLV